MMEIDNKEFQIIVLCLSFHLYMPFNVGLYKFFLNASAVERCIRIHLGFRAGQKGEKKKKIWVP